MQTYGKRIINHWHRLHKRFNALCIIYSSLGLAIEVAAYGQTQPDNPGSANFWCAQAKVVFRLPRSHAVLQAAYANKLPAYVEIEIAQEPMQSSNPNDPQTKGFMNVAHAAIQAFFIEFFEQYDEWLFRNVGPDPKNDWPMVWRFAYMVRNAIVHNGKISFNRKEPPVAWYGLSYEYKDNGTELIGVGKPLYIGDLFLLMLEMSDALDSYGCTI